MPGISHTAPFTGLPRIITVAKLWLDIHCSGVGLSKRSISVVVARSKCFQNYILTSTFAFKMVWMPLTARPFSKAQPNIWALYCNMNSVRVHIRPKSNPPGSVIVQEGAILPPQHRFSPDQELFRMEETQSNIFRSFSALHSVLWMNARNDL